MYSQALVVPSGFTSARYSPWLVSLKFVWSGAARFFRSLSEAKTRRKLSGWSMAAGKRHFVKFVRSSVKHQPLRFTGLVPAL